MSCNEILADDHDGIVIDNWVSPLSSWSLAVDLYSRYAFRTDLTFTCRVGKDLDKREAYAYYAIAVARLHE